MNIVFLTCCSCGDVVQRVGRAGHFTFAGTGALFACLTFNSFNEWLEHGVYGRSARGDIIVYPNLST